jgi:hypothetical protein
MNTKLSIGGSLREVFTIYWAGARVLLLFALVLSVLTVWPELLVENAIGVVGGFVLATAGTVLFQGVAVRVVEDLRDGGRTRSATDLLRSVAPVALPLIGAGLLAFAGIMIGTMLFIVPGLILLTIWAVIAPAIVVERVGVFGSFGRSQSLIRENGVRVFAVILPLSLIAFAAPFAGLLATGGSSDIALGPVLVSTLALAIVMPLTGIVPAVLYFRLRAIEDWPRPLVPSE